MQNYIGVKLVGAEPMTRGDYNTKRVRTAPADKNPADEGYCVCYPDGYTSWCPKEQFEKANRKTDGMSFGHAIESARLGLKIARAGWNGRGIFVMLNTPSDRSKMTQEYLYIDTTGLQTDNEAAPRCCVPWLASQTDMLADDWQLVE